MKKIFTYQKKAARATFFGDPLAHAKQIMLGMNVFKVYQVNIYQNLILPYEVHTATTSSIFFNLISFQRLIINPKRYKNSGNYTVFESTMKLAHSAISRRGTILPSTVLVAELKKK